MKRIMLSGIILVFVFSMLGCTSNKKPTVSTSEDVSPNSQSSKTQEPAAIEPTTGLEATSDNGEEQAEYFSTDNPDYKTIGNARFNFWIDIPNDWKAFDSSANGDGYFIVSDNNLIDIRVYGGLLINGSDDYLKVLKDNDGEISDFTFRDGTNGIEVVKSTSETEFTCLLKDRYISLYVNYGADKAWLEKNKDIVMYIAKSLRSGLKSENQQEELIDEVQKK